MSIRFQCWMLKVTIRVYHYSIISMVRKGGDSYQYRMLRAFDVLQTAVLIVNRGILYQRFAHCGTWIQRCDQMVCGKKLFMAQQVGYNTSDHIADNTYCVLTRHLGYMNDKDLFIHRRWLRVNGIHSFICEFECFSDFSRLSQQLWLEISRFEWDRQWNAKIRSKIVGSHDVDHLFGTPEAF